jgi:2Fe-2S ferredoxin
MSQVSFKNKNKAVPSERGRSILELALDFRVPIYHTCGGNASCSTCRILVLSGKENLSPIDKDEAQVLDSFDLKAPHRLACQALILGAGDIEVEIPERAKPCRDNKTPPIPE